MTSSEDGRPGQTVASDTAELARLAVLESYGILDTPPEMGFDDIVSLATVMCGTPIALVSFVAADRQWFKARIGFEECQTPLSQSVCAHALQRPGLLVIPDLSLDHRTCENPLVTQAPHIRFYAGARLEDSEGTPLGTLCVIDTKPRPQGLTRDQANALEALARQVMTLMELRRAIAGREEALARRRGVETRQALLIELGARLQAQGSPRGRMQAAVDALGRYLDVSRVGCALVEADAASILLQTEYNNGCTPLAGVYPLADFGAGCTASLKSGRTSICADVEADPDTAGIGLAELGIAAMLAVPQVHEGRLRSVVYVNHDTPRVWTPEEVTLVEEVAARIWDALERARAEDALEKALLDSMDFTRLALSAVDGVGVWTYHIPSDLFFCDAAISELYGLDPIQAAAGIRRQMFLANVHPDDLAGLHVTMGAGLGQSGDLELEYRIRHPDGAIRWVLSRGHTYCDETGLAIRRTGVGIETTRRRQLEERLRQKQKMEAVGQLTGGVAHDFNNLLTIIRSSVELLSRSGLTEDRRRRYIDAISDTTTRATKLTGQLLAFARRQALKPVSFDAVRSITAVGEMLETVTDSRIRIVIEVPPEPCFINGDPSQFDTAIVNMAVNARDAMAGEGLLTITVALSAMLPTGSLPSEAPDRSASGKEEQFVAVRIEDTGSGIARENLAQIFEPFFTTKPVGEGTGLGLSQVFGFARQSGGEVHVESELGRGTAFTLYMPRSAPGSAAEPRTTEPEPLEEGRGMCVLVLEDNHDVGSFTTRSLSELGYQTVWAPNAQEGLAELAKNSARFDVVFSDVVMPGMNGVDFGREVRRLYGDLPVILTSGYSHVLARDGADGFELVHKPYSVDQLSRILHRAADHRRHSRMAMN